MRLLPTTILLLTLVGCDLSGQKQSEGPRINNPDRTEEIKDKIDAGTEEVKHEVSSQNAVQMQGAVNLAKLADQVKALTDNNVKLSADNNKLLSDNKALSDNNVRLSADNNKLLSDNKLFSDNNVKLSADNNKLLSDNKTLSDNNVKLEAKLEVEAKLNIAANAQLGMFNKNQTTNTDQKAGGDINQFTDQMLKAIQAMCIVIGLLSFGHMISIITVVLILNRQHRKDVVAVATKSI